MKYIRTKDGIFEVIREDKKWFVVKFQGTGGVTIYKEIVKKQADTIRELGDALICGSEAYEGMTPFILDYYNLEERIKFYHKVKKCSIYVAIWVFDSNGTPTLKPAAKLNEEGAWVLL